MFPVPALASGVEPTQPATPTPTQRGSLSRLTRKESELLAVLQRNVGHCLTRGYLLQTIWGYEGPTRTRTLDVHIQRLRRKLGPRLGAQILTIFRTGYCWRHENNGDLN